MDVLHWLSVAGPAIGAAGALLPQLQTDHRKQIRADIELHRDLPEGTNSAMAALAAHIDKKVRALIDRENNDTRDWSGVAVAVILLAGGVALDLWAASLTVAWVRYPVFTVGVLFAVTGAFGFVESVVKKPRDQKHSTPDS